MKILAIETSCDETAAAIVESSEDGKYVKLLSHSLATSLAQHATTGGIIPENAARAQIQFIIPTIYEALEKSGLLREGVTGVENEPNGSSLARQAADAQRNGVERASAGGNSLTGPQASQTLIPDIDAIAVTYGPGLIGSLLLVLRQPKHFPTFGTNHSFQSIIFSAICTLTGSKRLKIFSLPNFLLLSLLFLAIIQIYSL